jgi:hypothetical protein
MADEERTFGEKVRALSDYVSANATYDVDAHREKLMQQRASLTSWFAGLNRQLSPGGEDSDAPIADHLVDGFNELGDSIQDVLANTENKVETIVCCILNAVLLMTYGEIVVENDGEQQVGRTRVEDLPKFEVRYNENYAITTQKYRKYLLFFRRMLAMIRSQSYQARAGGGEVFSAVLDLDIGYVISKVLKGAIAGPLLAGVFVLEAVINYVGAIIYNVLSDLRCAPIADMWATIVRWLFRRPFGFIGRVKSYLRSVLTDLRRDARRVSTGTEASAVEISVGVDPEVINQLIDVIDRLLEALDILIACPPPPTASAFAESASGRGREADRDPRGPTSPNPADPIDRDNGRDDTGDGQDDRTDGAEQGGSQTGGRTNRPAGNEGARRLPGGGYLPPGAEDTSNPTGGSSGRTESSPSSGAGGSSGREPSGESNYIYLTPDNIATVLIDGFGVSPARAREVTGDDSDCREELTDDARQALEQLGVQF